MISGFAAEATALDRNPRFTLSDLEFTPLQDQIHELIKKTRPPGKYAALNALLHLRRGWALRAIDPEMAIFRVITAYEESAAALFYALQRRKYRGAKRLNRKRHDHKAALVPFVVAVRRRLAPLEDLKPTLVLKRHGRGLRFGVRFRIQDSTGKAYAVEPMPPLHYSTFSDEVLDTFEAELSHLASKRGVANIRVHIERLANERNCLLYAAHNGIPAVRDLKDEFFVGSRDEIFIYLGLYLIILQYPERQAFVQQALDAFVRIVDRLPKA